MRKLLIAAAIIVAATSCSSDKTPIGLKDAMEGKFLVGTALNENQILHKDAKADSIIKLHFNAIVAENCMKHESIHPKEHEYNFDLADKFVEYGIQAGLTITGHCLIWHSQCAPWFCVDDNGNLVSPEVLKERMREHIFTVVQRYKGKILGWDVVNEAILEDGSYRNSPFYQILGEEYIPWAFQCAHEADPDIELYYNDYNMYEPGKRATVVKLISDLKARGLRIDAVGMQSHIGMDYPDYAEFAASMDAYIAAGVNVMGTEFDMSALPTITRSADVSQSDDSNLSVDDKAKKEAALAAFNAEFNPYTEGLPEEVAGQWNQRVKDFIQLFIDRADHVTRFTAWGLTDGDSWKNTFRAVRTDYPLLFGRDYAPKKVVTDLIEEYK